MGRNVAIIYAYVWTWVHLSIIIKNRSNTEVIMQFRFLFVFCSLLLIIATGCDNKIDSLFTPVEIPPPTSIADSLYTVTDTGLKYYDLEVGTGSLAEAGFAVQFHFITWLSDGSLVNSSYSSGFLQVTTLGANNLIPGWAEGLDGMRTGGFRQLMIPPELAYGAAGNDLLGIPPNETILMELSLQGVGIPVDQ